MDGIDIHIETVEVRPAQQEFDLTFTVEVAPPREDAERWSVTLDGYDPEADLEGLEPTDALNELVFLVKVHLEEWWHTKGHNRASRKLGHRID